MILRIILCTEESVLMKSEWRGVLLILAVKDGAVV